MISSYIIHPKIFCPEYFQEDSYYGDCLIHTLDEIYNNSIIIVDYHDRFLSEFEDYIDNIPEEFKQEIEIWYESVLSSIQSGDRAVIIKVPKEINRDETENINELILKIQRSCFKTDAIIVGEYEKIEINDLGFISNKILITLKEYRNCYARELALKNNSITLNDFKSDKKRDDIFGRIFRYSQAIDIYDPILLKIVKNRTSERVLLNSLYYILNLVKKYNYYSNKQISITIYVREVLCTDASTINEDQLNIHIANNKRIIEEFEQKIIEKIESKYSQWKFMLSVKCDPTDYRITHPRYLQTEYTLIRIDKGFQLYNSNNEFITNKIDLKHSDWSYINKVKTLPETRY